MNYLPNSGIPPVVTFNDIYDLFYDLFMEIGLAIGPDQYLYDQDTESPLVIKDKYIKASIDGTPIYPGKNDIIFDPAKNYTLMVSIFCYYLDKCKETEDGDILGGYVAHYIDDDANKEKQRVTVKTLNRGLIESNFYYNIYLSYIDCIFRIGGYNPDLSMFDIKPEGVK